MQITVRDFRGVADFSASLNGLLLVAGPNGSGKSSVCTAVGACLTGDLTPFEGVTRGKASMLVRGGGSTAVASVRDGENGVLVSWPDCVRTEVGRAPAASHVAAGLANPLDMTPKDRAAWLTALTGALPTHGQINEALAQVSGAEPELVWASIERHGWDGAHAEAKERGAKLKGQWERVTGQRYGGQKAAQWRPDGWRAALEGTSLDDLQAAADAANESVDAARRAALINETKRREAKERASRRQEALSQVEHAKGEMEAAKRALETAQGARDKLGVDAGRILKCPCCSAELVVLADGNLTKAPPDTGDRKAIAAADKMVRESDQAAVRKQAHYERLLDHIKAGDEAEQALAALGTIASDDERVAIATKALETANSLKAKRAVIEASDLHERIMQQAEVVRLLAPDGLRQQTLVASLRKFAGELLEITKAAGWRPVSVDADMAITYGGRPVSLCSAGEQYRVRSVLQIATARRDGSALVILDGADVLDNDGRNGLIHALGNVPALIGMTMKRDALPPKLIETGRAVWLGDVSVESNES